MPSTFPGDLTLGRRPRVDWMLTLPLAIPAMLLLAGNDAFGFDPPGWLDSFMFLGYFWHYPEHLWVFDHNSNYKISRLPWLLPGAVAHALFVPVTAARLLAFGTLASAGVALYLHVRDAIHDRYVAAFASVVLVCCSGMHAPGGWYYHALTAAGYYLWSCWLMTRAATANRNARSWAAAGGACFAAAVHTHVFLAVFTPLLVLLFWASLDVEPQQRRRRWLTSVTAALGGGVALTAALATINRLTGGDWLFFMPQVELAFKLSKSDPWWLPTEQWLPQATYLVVPIALIVTALTSGHLPWHREHRLKGTLVVLPCLALAITCVFQFWTRETTLDYDYMAFVLYLHALPAAAVALWSPGVDATRWRPTAVLTLATIIVVVPLLLLMPADLPGLMNRVTSRFGLTNAPLIVPPLLFGLAGVMATRAAPRRIRVVILAVWFSIVNAWTAPQPVAYGIRTPGTRQEMLEAFRDADEFTHRLDPTLTGIKYWISSETLPTPQGSLQSQQVFDSFLATRVWQTALFARTSPGLPIETLTLDHLAATRCLGILSSGERQRPLADAMMAHYATLERPLQLVADRQFRRGDLVFALTVLRPADSDETSPGAPPCLRNADEAP